MTKREIKANNGFLVTNVNYFSDFIHCSLCIRNIVLTKYVLLIFRNFHTI